MKLCKFYFRYNKIDFQRDEDYIYMKVSQIIDFPFLKTPSVKQMIDSMDRFDFETLEANYVKLSKTLTITNKVIFY